MTPAENYFFYAFLLYTCLMLFIFFRIESIKGGFVFSCAKTCPTCQGRREHGLKRIHFSCIRCIERRRLKNPNIKGYRYSKGHQSYIPLNRRDLCEFWTGNNDPYLLMVNTTRRFTAEKDVLLNALWRLALRWNRPERVFLLRKVVSLCEFLAS
jgi:hypothetical protein